MLGVIQSLPPDEKPAAEDLFDWINTNQAMMKRSDLDQCVQAVQQFLANTGGSPSTERSRKVVAQLRAIAETYLFQDFGTRVGIVMGLPSEGTEQKDASDLFDWIDANQTVMKRKDLDLCIQVVQKFPDDWKVPQPERSRMAVTRLQAIVAPYRKLKKRGTTQ